MRIIIDYVKIHNSPYNEVINDAENNDLDQLEKHLVYGNNTSVLVSGYRGAGKTSLIYQLSNRLGKHKKTLFICIEISKYENYSMILRKIIRAIYWNLNSNNNTKNKESIKGDLSEKIDELYLRTFNDVTYNYNVANKSEKDRNIVSTLDIKTIAKKVIPLVSVFLFGLNFKFNFITNNNTLFFILSLLYVIYDNMGMALKWTRSNNTVYKDEINRKTLYDDEIAEHHVKTLLKDLKDQGFKTIIALDEIDKIEDQKNIENIISELKPLMLSDTASFIIVCGQKLYYKYASSNTVDDSLISSVFSKTIHVQLLSKKSLADIFKSLITNKDKLNEKVLDSYIDSLILNSNRIIRRFLNIISKNIKWEKEIAYIEAEDCYQFYENDSRYLNIISDENNKLYKIISGADPGFKDFFIIQLHIWVQKIKQRGSGEFRKEDILCMEEYKDECLRNCLNDIDTLFDGLIDILLTEKLLSRRPVKISELDTLYFKVVQKDDLIPEVVLKDIRREREDYLNKAYNIEKLVDIIFYELLKYKKELFANKYDNSIISSIMKASILNMIGVINDETNNDFKLNIQAKEYLNMSAVISESDIEIIRYHRRPDLQSNLIENYIYYLINGCLQAGFTIERDKYFNYIASNKTTSSYVFYLLNYDDVKMNDDTRLYSLVESFKSYNMTHNTKNTLIVLVWGNVTRSEVENLYYRIRKNNEINLHFYTLLVFISEQNDNYSIVNSFMSGLSNERL